MREKRITTDQAKAFNAVMGELIAVAQEAVERVEKAGSSEFICSNYRQAVLGASYIAKYVRDFGGSSATAAIENRIQGILESVSPAKLAAEDKAAYSRKKKTKDG